MPPVAKRHFRYLPFSGFYLCIMTNTELFNCKWNTYNF